MPGTQGVGEVLQHDHEFVTPQPAQGVPFPDAGQDPPGGLDQQFVAGMMAEGVVHRLEVIQIQKQDGQPGILAPGLLDGMFRPQVQQHAVGQAGQGVMMRHVPQLFLGLFPAQDDAGDLGAGFEQTDLEFVGRTLGET